MIRRGLLLAILVSALNASATWSPRFETNDVGILEGDTMVITVRARWSGLTDYGFSPWTFRSSDETVAGVTGGLEKAGETGYVTIKAKRLGSADIYEGAAGSSYPGGPYVHITVLPRPLEIHIATPATTTPAFGQHLTLTAVCQDSLASIVWYAGHIGDTSHPLVSYGRELTITSDQPGEHFYWVLARTSDATAMDEVFISVQEPARRRAARH